MERVALSVNPIEGKIKEKLPTLQVDMIEDNLIVYPQNSEEVSSFIRLCNDEKINIIPVGSGTQIAKADHTGVYLSTRKMNKIVELAKADLTVSVEAGMTIKELAEALKEYNFLLPVSHQEKPNSTIGSLLARDAGGIEQYAYSTINDYVIGLDFITPTGELIKAGGKTVKNVTGYDFTRLFAKSWGTLGVITKATFKLVPMPVEKALFITHGDSIDELTQQMKEILSKRYALATFMGMSSKLLGIDEGSKYGGVFVLAGSRQAVAHQLDALRNILDIKQVITGIYNVDDYLEGILNSKTLWGNIEIGTDRRTLLNDLPRILDAIMDNASMEILIDGGRGLIQLTDMVDVQEVKNMFKDRLKDFKCSFSDDRAPVDILYNKLKKDLDPNGIMYPNNPRFMEVG